MGVLSKALTQINRRIRGELREIKIESAGKATLTSQCDDEMEYLFTHALADIILIPAK